MTNFILVLYGFLSLMKGISLLLDCKLETGSQQKKQKNQVYTIYLVLVFIGWFLVCVLVEFLKTT